MKKTLTSVAVMGFFALATTAAHANDGSITFTGSLVDMTCQVQVNNGSSAGAVTLPTVSVAGLTTTGETSGDTNFDIKLTACVGAKPTVVTKFLPGGSVSVDGRLINEISTGSGGADNVELEVLDRVTSTPIKLGDDAQLLATAATIDGSGNATLPYIVRYFATSDAGAKSGAVRSTVQFSLVYP